MQQRLETLRLFPRKMMRFIYHEEVGLPDDWQAHVTMLYQRFVDTNVQAAAFYHNPNNETRQSLQELSENTEQTINTSLEQLTLPEETLFPRQGVLFNRWRLSRPPVLRAKKK